jgi:poly [ADP-ribose] polymerase
MPPKRAASKKAAPVTPFLEDCVLAIAGTFNNLTQAQIEAIVTAPEFGATVANTVTKKVTHLITNAAELAKFTTKVTKATILGSVQFVTLDWILDMQQQKKRLDESLYKIAPAAAAPTTPITPVSAASPAAADPSKSATAKRKASAVDTDDEDDEKAAVEKKIKTLKEKVDKSTSKVRQPAVDPACGLRTTHKVYTDDDVAWDARLNQTNIGFNNNKFYRVQLLVSAGGQYAVYCHWGRVGAHGQSSTDNCYSLDAGKALFEKKYKDKTRNNWADRDNFVKVAGKLWESLRVIVLTLDLCNTSMQSHLTLRFLLGIIALRY